MPPAICSCSRPWRPRLSPFSGRPEAGWGNPPPLVFRPKAPAPTPLALFRLPRSRVGQSASPCIQAQGPGAHASRPFPAAPKQGGAVRLPLPSGPRPRRPRLSPFSGRPEAGWGSPPPLVFRPEAGAVARNVKMKNRDLDFAKKSSIFVSAKEEAVYNPRLPPFLSPACGQNYPALTKNYKALGFIYVPVG